MSPDPVLTGRAALVTGAARGQGRAHALALARAGAEVLACDLCRSVPTVPYSLALPEDLEETARLVRAEGRRCLSRMVDAADPEAMWRVVREAEAELGGIDVVCANAGVISFGRAWELSEEQWDDVVRTNLKGAWATCKAVVPGMIERGRGGSIVLVSSAAGLRGYPGIAHYVASKHGVVGLMRSLAIELAPYGIRVNCVLPGGVRTPMGTAEAMGRWLEAEPEAARALAALLTVDLVEPEDVSAAVVWLASEAARFVTGVALPIDAGVQLR
ncbi:MAG TPA: mycofactocin-coupled SDR family oxidoreductase [Candidatus Dormibacteraeota bacterium]|nr:mycofactocin-coupled SDR family oxidoreductase [Candidatus Dormibacteraeota bacterium]